MRRFCILPGWRQCGRRKEPPPGGYSQPGGEASAGPRESASGTLRANGEDFGEDDVSQRLEATRRRMKLVRAWLRQRMESEKEWPGPARDRGRRPAAAGRCRRSWREAGPQGCTDPAPASNCWTAPAACAGLRVARARARKPGRRRPAPGPRAVVVTEGDARPRRAHGRGGVGPVTPAP